MKCSMNILLIMDYFITEFSSKHIYSHWKWKRTSKLSNGKTGWFSALEAHNKMKKEQTPPDAEFLLCHWVLRRWSMISFCAFSTVLVAEIKPTRLWILVQLLWKLGHLQEWICFFYHSYKHYVSTSAGIGSSIFSSLLYFS